MHSAVCAMALCVCPSVCHKPILYRSSLCVAERVMLIFDIEVITYGLSNSGDLFGWFS